MAESFMIQISSNLVNRLSGDENKIKKTKKPKPKNSQEPQQPPSKVKPDPNMPTSHPGVARPLQHRVFLPVAPPPPVATAELEAILSVHQESERVAEKLERQESNMLQELDRKAKELHEKEFKMPYQNPTPCRAEKDACLQCYEDDDQDPLKCAQLVKNFTDCARQVWQQIR